MLVPVWILSQYAYLVSQYAYWDFCDPVCILGRLVAFQTSMQTGHVVDRLSQKCQMMKHVVFSMRRSTMRWSDKRG